MFWRFYRLEDQTQVGDGTKNYTIGSSTYPMRMKGLTEVFVATTTDTDKTLEASRIALVDFNTYKVMFNANNAQKICYEWFDAANDLWKLHINPAPAATETITYSYYWEPPVKTATTDKILCPDVKIIALIALADLYDGEDETDLADRKRNEAEQMISEYIGKENAPAVNQLYGMGAIESATVTRGVGTY